MKRIDKAVFILCVILLLLFPLGVLVRITPFPNVNIYLQDIVVGLLAIIIFFKVLSSGIRNNRSIVFPIITFNLIAIISLALYSKNLELSQIFTSLSYLVRFDAYTSLIFLFLFNFEKKNLKLLDNLFVFSTFVVVVGGFVQYIFYNNLRNLYYLGWDEHLHRLFSSFLDPNFAGVLFALFLILLLYRLLNKEGKFTFRLSSCLMVFSTVIALLLTHSRSALIALIAGFSILFLSMKKIRLLILSGIIILSGAFLVSDFSIEGMNPLRIASSEARIRSATQALEIFSENALIGIGFNTYRYEQIRKGFISEELSETSNADAGTDNSFLFILSTTGVVGFIAYIFIWWGILRKLRTQRVLAVSLICALYISSLFINALIYIPIMTWLFLYLGIFGLRNYSD